MAQTKPALTFDELLDKLKQRGLTITCPDKIKVLNYYFIRGYAEYGGLTQPVEPNEYKFVDGLTFDDVYHIFLFDSELKSIILQMIGFIEKSIKTVLANTLANYYKMVRSPDNKQVKTKLGALCYFDQSIYKNKKDMLKGLDLMNKLIDRLSRKKRDKMFKHNLEKFDGLLPCWVAFNYFDFAELITYISKLDNNIRDSIFNSSKTKSLSFDELMMNLHLIRKLRNTCAHFDRLYGLTFYYQLTGRSTNDPNNDHTLYQILLIMRNFCQIFPLKDEWNNMVEKIQTLLVKPENNLISIERFGFESSWKEILLIP